MSDDLSWRSAQNALRRLAAGLRAAGHTVRCLRADGVTADLPGFDDADRRSFDQLADEEISAYRETFRQRLDADVVDFDPQIIHTQHVWIQGHLALETGVPYILTARGPELRTYLRDPRYRRYADEAVAGAARILTAAPAVRDEVARLFPHADERLTLLPEPGENGPAWATALTAVYEAVLLERFGS